MENKRIRLRLSSSARYSHTLSSLVNSGQSILPFGDQSIFEGLCKQQREAANERNTITKSLVSLLGALFLITNNGDFVIPILKLRLAELPSVVEILLLLASIAAVILVMKFKDVMMYDEIISLWIKKKYGGSKKEQDIIKASFLNESLSFRIYNHPYFPGDYELFESGFLGKMFDVLVMFSFLIFFISLFLVPLVYLAYISYYFIPSTNTGLIVSGISQFFIAFSLILMFTSFFKFPNFYENGEWKFD